MTSKKNGQNNLSVPFHRLTEEELRQWYEDKLIATSGYLLAIRQIKAPPGTPFVIPNVMKFCEDWGIARSAFYRAVDYLRDKGYFSWEATHGIILSDSKKVISFPTEKKCPTDGTQLQPRDTKSHERDTESHTRDTKSHERDTKSHTRDTKSSKSSQRKPSSAPQIYSDKSDIQTLSDLPEAERENFEKFVREEHYKNKREKINSFTAFMSNGHFQEWLERYQNRPEAVQATADTKWRSHPQFENWVNEIESSGNPMMFASGNKEKKEFIKWANENKIFSWQREEG